MARPTAVVHLELVLEARGLLIEEAVGRIVRGITYYPNLPPLPSLPPRKLGLLA